MSMENTAKKPTRNVKPLVLEITNKLVEVPGETVFTNSLVILYFI